MLISASKAPELLLASSSSSSFSRRGWEYGAVRAVREGEFMGATMVVETAMEFLVPSWWEVQVTVAAAAFVVVAYWFFSMGGDGGRGGGDRAFEDGSGSGLDMVEDKDKVIFAIIVPNWNCLSVIFVFFFGGKGVG